MKLRFVLFAVTVALSAIVPVHAEMNLLKPDDVPEFDKDSFNERAETDKILEMEDASCGIFSGDFKAKLRCKKTFRNLFFRLTYQDPEKCFMELPVNIVTCFAYANRWWLPSHANSFSALNSNRWDTQFVNTTQTAFRATVAGRTLVHLSIFTDRSSNLQAHCRKNEDVGISFGIGDQRQSVELKRWVRPSTKPEEEQSCLFYGYATLDEGTYDIEVSNLKAEKGSVALIKLE